MIIFSTEFTQNNITVQCRVLSLLKIGYELQKQIALKYYLSAEMQNLSKEEQIILHEVEYVREMVLLHLFSLSLNKSIFFCP